MSSALGLWGGAGTLEQREGPLLLGTALRPLRSHLSSAQRRGESQPRASLIPRVTPFLRLAQTSVKGGWRCPVPGNTQDPVGQGSEQPDLVEAAPAHCRAGLNVLQRSLPIQTIPFFYYSQGMNLAGDGCLIETQNEIKLSCPPVS